MEHTSSISILVSVTGHAAQLPLTLGSMTHQTCQNIQIILLDSGSADGSGDVCRRFASMDRRIQYIAVEGGDPAGLWNAGLAAATGDYILFAYGGDCLAPYTAEQLLHLAEKSAPDLIQFAGQSFSKTEIPGFDRSTGKVLNVTTLAEDAFLALYPKRACPGLSGWLFRAALLRELPLSGSALLEDAWFTRALSSDRKIVYYDKPLYFYSADRAEPDTAASGVFPVIEARIRVLTELGLTELIPYEAEQLFHTLLYLYKAAKVGKNKAEQKALLDIFRKNRAVIRQYYINPKKPFAFFKSLMLLCPPAIALFSGRIPDRP